MTTGVYGGFLWLAGHEGMEKKMETTNSEFKVWFRRNGNNMDTTVVIIGYIGLV